jgi:hypothetical protein
MPTSLRSHIVWATLALSFAAVPINTAIAGSSSTPPPKRAAFRAELFAPDIVSTRDYERDGTFSPDGHTFLYTKRTMWPYFAAICVTEFRNGAWAKPEVASFSGQYSDLTPSFSLDGKHLYFASRRPIKNATSNGASQASAGYTVWVVDRRDDGSWSEPSLLAYPINGHDNVVAPIETHDGSFYFFKLDDSREYVARRSGNGWSTPTPVGDAATAESAELGAYVDPDERYMIVTVIGRKDALNSAEGVYPRADLYARTRQGNGWSTLRHLSAPINSAAEEGSPFVSPDGRFLYFMSERGVFTEHGQAIDAAQLDRALHNHGNGLGDIYRIDLRATGIDLRKSATRTKR